MMNRIWLTVALATVHCTLCFSAISKPIYIQPEQIHISLGAQPNEIVVTWTTFDRTKKSTVYYGVERMDQVAYGFQTLFVDGGDERREMYIHRVYLSDLDPDTYYVYHCGSSEAWSEQFRFKTFPSGSNWKSKFMIYGDLGNLNSISLGSLQDEIQRNHYDSILHVGDLAYDLQSDNGRVGDEFMRQIQSMAAYVPYQVCPGNHEHAYNFSNYNNRFTMHSQDSKQMNNFFWSQNIGLVHLISFSTEFLYYPEYGTDQIVLQYQWLKEDLANANRPENRKQHPWIITMAHRPIYSHFGTDELLRDEFEKLFYKYGVDLSFWGHIHNYQRFLPMYDNKIVVKNPKNPYKNPKAPIHIVTGSAGCKSKTTPLPDVLPDGIEFATTDYGFTVMTVHNSSQIDIEQVSVNKDGQVVDQFSIVKTEHGQNKIG